MKELFLPIKGYEGLYEISNLGNVKSFIKSNASKGDFLKNILRGDGYYAVALWKDKKRIGALVHRLIATAFIENQYNYECVDHIDGNKQNNSIENLRWCTLKQNLRFDNRKKSHNTSKYVGVSFDKYWGKWRAFVAVNGKNKSLGNFKTEYEAYLKYKEFVEME
jgi:hypothetical protein